MKFRPKTKRNLKDIATSQNLNISMIVTDY